MSREKSGGGCRRSGERGEDWEDDEVKHVDYEARDAMLHQDQGSKRRTKKGAKVP